jgi:hypothetical protein
MQGMPSVADVFGGMSEEQIAEQVREGQRFIEELQKNGSPEDIKAFDDLLMQTLNSMSEADFNDIQNIAKLVEPHLDLPQEQPKPIEPEVKPEAKPKSIEVEGSDVESFQNFIGAISKGIDELFQKMEGSKDCAEEINAKWKSKATFSNMKRQIYQLKTKRLSEKLSKKDLASEEDTLVKNLKKLAKDLTKHNDDFKLEDDFGLPSSYAQERKYLKKAKSILSSLDGHIDLLMPSLEKFLRKWDPEALEMAKEADVKTAKAAKDAIDATKKTGSLESRFSDSYGPSSSRYGQSPAEYPNYGPGGYGGYPDYYDQGGYNPNMASSPGSASSDETSRNGSAAPADKKADIKTPETKEEKEKQKVTVSPYDEVMGDISDHTTKYSSQHEQDFVKFMSDEISKYPDATNNTPDTLKAFSTEDQKGEHPMRYVVNAQGIPVPTNITNPDSATTWINNDFKDYTTNIQNKLRSTFLPEFDDLDNVLQTMTKNIPNMGADELAKIPTNTNLAEIQRRLSVYQKAFEPIEQKLNDIKKNYDPLFLSDPQVAVNYKNAHDTFVNSLNGEIGSKLTALSERLDRIKRKAKRNVGALKTSETKKAKQ